MSLCTQHHAYLLCYQLHAYLMLCEALHSVLLYFIYISIPSIHILSSILTCSYVWCSPNTIDICFFLDRAGDTYAPIIEQANDTPLVDWASDRPTPLSRQALASLSSKPGTIVQIYFISYISRNPSSQVGVYRCACQVYTLKPCKCINSSYYTRFHCGGVLKLWFHSFIQCNVYTYLHWLIVFLWLIYSLYILIYSSHICIYSLYNNILIYSIYKYI
jgi:hypothetical protein